MKNILNKLFKKKKIIKKDVIVVDGGLKRISYDKKRRRKIAQQIWDIPLGGPHSG